MIENIGRSKQVVMKEVQTQSLLCNTQHELNCWTPNSYRVENALVYPAKLQNTFLESNAQRLVFL